MKTFKAPLCVYLCIVLSGCVTSSDTGDDFEDPSFPKGPGLFSGDKGELSLSEAFAEKRTGEGFYMLDLNGAPTMTEEEFKEFQAFRAWQRARDDGSSEYEEYQRWRAFQKFNSKSN